jgi:nitroreductase
MNMDVASFRGILHERTHHTIEVLIYRILNGKLKKPDNFGVQAAYLLEIWKERKLPTDTPDLLWVKTYVAMAEKINKGEPVKLDIDLPKPFEKDEMKTVERLLYDRRSIRQFKPDPIPEEMINKILYAGIMSPQGCNVDARRFIVIQDPEKMKLVNSDIPIENGVMILVCQDMGVYKTLRFHKMVPQNIYYDAACAADHICLMAHALGLGACWLTHGELTQRRVRDYFKLKEDIVTRCHIIMGWPAETPIKSERMKLEEAIIGRT